MLLLLVLSLVVGASASLAADCTATDYTGSTYTDALTAWRAAGITGEIFAVPSDGIYGVVVNGPSGTTVPCGQGFIVGVGDGGFMKNSLGNFMSIFALFLVVGWIFGTLANMLKRS